jgi:small subunit ribosomal protein S2
LTNFTEIRKKIRELQNLNKFIEKEEFLALIKKEQVLIQKRRDKLNSVYEGVIDLNNKPDALFIIDLEQQQTALKEAKKMNIPVIAVCNTSSDPEPIDYVLPGNNKEPRSILFFANLFSKSVNSVRNKK